MPGALGPILTAAVALGTAAVVVANPVNAPRADIRIPALVSSTEAGDAVGMLDEEFLRALAPEPAGPSNPMAALKDVIAVLVANAAYLGRTVIGDDTDKAGARPELTAASYPYFGDAPYVGDAPGWNDGAPLIASGGLDATVPGRNGAPEVAPSPPMPSSTPSLSALPEWVDTDLRNALDQASEMVSGLPDTLSDVGDSVLAGDLVSPLSDMVDSVRESVEEDLSVLRDVSANAVSNIGSRLLPSAEKPRSDHLVDVVDSLDGIGIKRDSGFQQIRPDGGSGGPRGAIERAAERATGPNGE